MKAVDLFAGFGGFSLAAESLGLSVVYAANHWPLAVSTHAANHPNTEHVCQDLRQADWSKLPDYDVLLASPACQGHSSASRPRRRRFHNAMRATAWAVVDCVDVTRPTALVVENVVDFTSWELFPVWKEALRILGYTLTENVTNASRFGVPQRRERLFMVARRGERVAPIVEPFTVEPAFGPCIDWSDGEWRDIARAQPGARARMEAARSRLGDRCLSQHVTGHRGVSLAEPIRTITCQDHWVAIDGDRYRPLTLREIARGMGFPDAYRLPDGAGRTHCVTGLGNAVVPAQAAAAIGSALGASTSLRGAA